MTDERKVVAQPHPLDCCPTCGRVNGTLVRTDDGREDAVSAGTYLVCGACATIMILAPSPDDARVLYSRPLRPGEWETFAPARQAAMRQARAQVLDGRWRAIVAQGQATPAEEDRHDDA